MHAVAGWSATITPLLVEMAADVANAAHADGIDRDGVVATWCARGSRGTSEPVLAASWHLR